MFCVQVLIIESFTDPIPITRILKTSDDLRFIFFAVSVYGSNRKHESEGQLNVELVWLNAVAPQSPSQVSKSNRTFRSWNLLTALAPSCCAWLAPADRMMCASQRLNIALQHRYFTTVSAALTLASQNQDDKKALRISKASKYKMLTELSKWVDGRFEVTRGGCRFTILLQVVITRGRGKKRRLLPLKNMLPLIKIQRKQKDELRRAYMLSTTIAYLVLHQWFWVLVQCQPKIIMGPLQNRKQWSLNIEQHFDVTWC